MIGRLLGLDYNIDNLAQLDLRLECVITRLCQMINEMCHVMLLPGAATLHSFIASFTAQ